MNSDLRDSLDRTLLLMRDEVTAHASDEDLVAALTGTRVVLAGDAKNLTMPAGQSAYITAALLMARSAHTVYLIAPDVPLTGSQPPLTGTSLITSLLEVGRDMLPGFEFSTELPPSPVALCVTVGDTVTTVQARHFISLNASAWTGFLDRPASATRWREPSWPMGALVAGALAAAEAFKVAMQRLRPYARRPGYCDKLFASNAVAQFSLAPEGTPIASGLGQMDFVSGGAITNAAIYCLLRLPQVCGDARVIDNTTSDLSNLNRYMMQPRSQLEQLKSETLQGFSTRDLRISSANMRLEASTFAALMPLAPRVLVGVDHIPTRWFVQESNPEWLVIGASTHWNSMASFHVRGLACARCAHPRDDDNDARIPTVAFVSFWAGLLQVAYLLRHVGQGSIGADDQHVFYTPVRPEAPWRGNLLAKPDCPTCGRRQAA